MSRSLNLFAVIIVMTRILMSNNCTFFAMENHVSYKVLLLKQRAGSKSFYKTLWGLENIGKVSWLSSSYLWSITQSSVEK